MRRRAADGEAAAFPLVEAILVALLILTAVLFFTLTQRPSGLTASRGLDLGQISSDTLSILQRKTFSGLGFEDWVNRTAAGDAAMAADVEEFMDEVLPTGARYEMRLSNGVGHLTLLPRDATGEPSGASAAEVPYFPDWDRFKGQATTGTGVPGREVTDVPGQAAVFALGTAASIQCIVGPNHASTGPGGATWLSLWRSSAPRVDPNSGITLYRVPDGMPYGAWAGYTDPACTTGPVYARVAHPAGTVTDHPLYGLQLVVWFGA